MEKFLARIPIARRTLLIVAALLLPLGGLLYFTLEGFQENIRFARLESDGVRYLQPLVRLVEQLATYQIAMGRQRAGDAQAGGAVEPARRAVDDTFAGLLEVEGALGSRLGFADADLRARQRENLAALAIKKRWEELRDRAASLPPDELAARVGTLLSDVRAAITLVGDNSNLVLDPDLDSFYLMDAMLVALPSGLDRVGRFEDFVRAALAGTTVASSNSVRFAVEAARVREIDFDRAVASLKSCLESDAKFNGISPSLRPGLEGPMEKLRATGTALLELFDRQAASSAPVDSAARVIDRLDAFRGASMELWKVSASELATLLDLRMAAIAARRTSAIIWVGAFLALGGLAFWKVSRSIVDPIARLTRAAGQIATGDFTVEVPFTRRPDEAGELARGIESMVSCVRRLMGELSQSAQTLTAASSALTHASAGASNGAAVATEKSGTVAAAAEESSANSTSVAAGIEQASTSLTSVASATEEMSATVGEIAANAEKARHITEQATIQARTVSELMRRLGDAAQEIGKVTETITDISSQTNLLALNATIEAARAGAAGKGFAVVANEIKELARQTASATEDIKARIDGVQTSAGGTIADIEKISGVIGEIGALVSGIAAAIEEQAVVTKDVAHNISQASAGVKDASERVAQTATVSKDIARDIAGVNQAMAGVREGGRSVEQNAGSLIQLADHLKLTLAQFRV